MVAIEVTPSAPKFVVGERVVRKKVDEDNARAKGREAQDGDIGVVRSVYLHPTWHKIVYYMDVVGDLKHTNNYWFEENCQPEISDEELNDLIEAARSNLARWFTPH